MSRNAGRIKYIIENRIPCASPASLGTEHQITDFKSFPTFKPIGNLFRGEEIDPYDLHFTCEVNGTVVQSCYSGDMIFSIDEQIAAVCTHLGLRELPPGTLINTGTSAGIGFKLQHPEDSCLPQTRRYRQHPFPFWSNQQSGREPGVRLQESGSRS